MKRGDLCTVVLVVALAALLFATEWAASCVPWVAPTALVLAALAAAGFSLSD